MKYEEIKQEIEQLQKSGKSMFLTSSFQTQSVPLLHIISTIDKNIPIYFLNTGYLFPETLNFIDELKDLLGLYVQGLTPSISKLQQRDASGNMLYATDPDYCCEINKLRPMDALLQQYDYWISGVRADQNKNRAGLKLYEVSDIGADRFHPMLDWTAKKVYDYINENKLPKHPLEADGYVSIGCEPCTRKYMPGDIERGGRWFGLSKSECGLHTELVKRKE